MNKWKNKDIRLRPNKVISVARTEYVKWITDPRMIIVLVTFIFIYDYIIREQLTAADKMHTNIMLAEPFVATANSEFIILLIPAVFLVLISDFPKTDGNTLFYIQRIGKTNWLLGQVLFSIMASCSYLFVIYLTTVIVVCHKAYLSDTWSDVVTRYVQIFPKESRSKIAKLINGRLYNNLSPFRALIRSFFLQWLFLVLIAMLLLLGFTVGRRMAGMLVTSSIIGVGSGLCLLDSNIKWTFPSANALLWLRYDPVLKTQVVNVRTSYWYFLVLIAVLLVISLLTVSRYDFSKVTDMED